jgi:hypothetical protein
MDDGTFPGRDPHDCGCGCGGKRAGALDVPAGAPDLQELDALLAEASATPPASDISGFDLDALDGLLATAEEVELEAAGGPTPALEDLLKLAERYPGLKITLSF